MSCGTPHLMKLKIIKLDREEEGELILLDLTPKKMRFIVDQQDTEKRQKIKDKLAQQVGKDYTFLRGYEKSVADIFFIVDVQ